MTRDNCGMRDILAEISSFDFMRNYEKKNSSKTCKSKSRETKHNLLKIEKEACKNAQENLKLAMKKPG